MIDKNKSMTLIITLVAVVLFLFFFLNKIWPRANKVEPAYIPETFIYSFNEDGDVIESNRMEESTSPYWWVSSGGMMQIRNGVGQTIQGSLPSSDWLNVIYSRSNPIDSDNGQHPQNTFRAVLGKKWQDFRQEIYFKINANHFTDSPNRNESNGLLLFNRYQDKDNLYYAGIRVDGTAVIKKKIGGIYYTLDQQSFINGKYDKDNNPSLLPLDRWLGVRSEVVSTSQGYSLIKLFIDIGKTGTWKLVAQATDRGEDYGPIIKSDGYIGIRTDFMDVSFDDYKIEDLKGRGTNN